MVGRGRGYDRGGQVADRRIKCVLLASTCQLFSFAIPPGCHYFLLFILFPEIDELSCSTTDCSAWLLWASVCNAGGGDRGRDRGMLTLAGQFIVAGGSADGRRQRVKARGSAERSVGDILRTT